MYTRTTPHVFEVPVDPLRVSVETLEDIFISAIESGQHGIMYWCPKLRLRSSKYPDAYDPAGDPAPAKFPIEDIIAVEMEEGEVWNGYLARNLVAGGTVTLYELSNEATGELTPHVLTREGMINGLARALSVGGGFTDRVVGHNEDGTADIDVDGPMADVVVQVAIFSEVVYG